MNAKNLVSTLLLLATLAAGAPAFAGDGTNSGGGGGGFCFSVNNCITLGEAGFRLPPGTPRFMFGADVANEVQKITSQLPIRTTSDASLDTSSSGYVDEILGLNAQMLPVQQQDVGRFNKIVNQYKKLIAQYAPSLPIQKFALFAVSESNKNITYLLPQFFQLSSHDQALLLIHEHWIRNGGDGAVPYAIVIDGIINDILTKSRKSDVIDYYMALWDFSNFRYNGRQDPNSGDKFLGLESLLSQKIGRKLTPSDFCQIHTRLDWFQQADDGAVYQYYTPESYNCTITYEMGFAGDKNIDSRFSKWFVGAQLEENYQVQMYMGNLPVHHLAITDIHAR